MLALLRNSWITSGAREGTAIRVSESFITGEASWQEFASSASEKRTPSNPRLDSNTTAVTTASEADIKVTRDLIRAGQLIKIELLDSVIVGASGHASLRELVYFL